MLVLVLAGVALYAASKAHDDELGQELGQIRDLVESAVKLPGEIDRVRLELWPKLALLSHEDRPDALGILLGTADRTRDQGVRRFLVESLGALGGSGLDDQSRSTAVDFLLGVARDPNADPPTRYAAISALPSIDTSERVTAELFAFASGKRADSAPQLGQRTSLQEGAIRALGQCRTQDAGGD